MLIIYLGIAVGVISLCIAKAEIFIKVRDWFFNRNYEFLHSLISCPYCLSFWVSLVATIIWQPNLIGTRIIDLCISYFNIVFVANISQYFFFWLMNKAEKD